MAPRARGGQDARNLGTAAALLLLVAAAAYALGRASAQRPDAGPLLALALLVAPFVPVTPPPSPSPPLHASPFLP
jgi:hypothetical protein